MTNRAQNIRRLSRGKFYFSSQSFQIWRQINSIEVRKIHKIQLCLLGKKNHYDMNNSQVVPAQSRTRDKTYPDFLTSKSYPIFTEVYHLVPADHQVVPE